MINLPFSSFDIKSAARIGLTKAVKSTSDPAEENLSRHFARYDNTTLQISTNIRLQSANAGSFRVDEELKD